MKISGVFIALLLLAIAAQAQTEVADTIIISGRITKSATLKKDWTSANNKPGNKSYPIYWIEFTLNTDSISITPGQAKDHLPPILVFASPTNGLWSELQPYREFSTGDKVYITANTRQWETYLNNESRSIPIRHMGLLP